MSIKVLRHADDCPKCGDSPFLGKVKYCWASNTKCPVWRQYGGEHLHRSCYTCGYIWPILPRDAKNDQTDDEWLEDKVKALTECLDSDIDIDRELAEIDEGLAEIDRDVALLETPEDEQNRIDLP